MAVSDWLVLVGVLVSLGLGLLNYVLNNKRNKVQNNLDSVNGDTVAYDLYEKYSNKVKTLEERIEYLTDILDGDLHLVISFPLKQILHDGQVQTTMQVKHIKQ